MYSKKETLLFLNALGLSNKAVTDIRQRVEELPEIMTMDSRELRETLLMSSKETVEKILEKRDAFQLNKLKEFLYKNGMKVTTPWEEDYPANLEEIDNKPMLLYYKGDILPKDALAIAIVGARKNTAYGKWAADYIAKELAALDVTIVSGLAAGIDRYAHLGALDGGGRTIGVLGTGIDRIYPSGNAGVYQRVEESGTIMTEYPLGTPPLPFRFPQRNRIISGLSLGVVVIEAKEKSGTLITAGFAAEQGREVFAVPGNINSIYSKGTNLLLKDGAKLVTSVDDIIEEIYQLKMEVEGKEPKQMSLEDLSEDEEKIYSLLKVEPRSRDEICSLTGMTADKVNQLLTRLELKEYIMELNGSKFYMA